MTEFEIKRVVITCDAAADLRLATAAAAALASQHGATLHGIFFEDENLYRAAELEIAAHTSLSSAYAAHALTASAIKERLEITSLGMRRALEAAAAPYRLNWSFSTLRATSARALPVADGDMLVVDAGTKPFSGGWRPRSPWLSAIIDIGSTVLLRRGHAGRGIVAMAPQDPTACDRVVRAVAALCRPEMTVAVLTATPDVRAHIEQLRPPGIAAFRFEPRPGQTFGIVARVRQLDPELIVISIGEDAATRHALVEQTSNDLLLVK